MTPLDKSLRRALEIGERSYTLLVDASGLKLTEKGKRKALFTLAEDDLGLAPSKPGVVRIPIKNHTFSIDGLESPSMLAGPPASLLNANRAKRKGIELKWNDLVSGNEALAVALRASVSE